jgi:O-antigen/teichoic acid export membrane protein
MKKTKNSIVLGIKSDLIIFILKIILGFGTIPVYLYFLELDAFGYFIAVQSVIALLSLADIGLGQYVVKKLSNKKYYDEHALTFLPSIQIFQYLLAGCLFIIGIVGFYFVSGFLNVEEALKEEVNWLFLFSWSAVTLKTTFGLIPSILQAKSLLAYLNIMNFLIFLSSIVINILFLSVGYGLSSLGLSLLIANMVVIFIMYLRLNKETAYRFLLPTKFDKTYVYEGWDYVKKFQLLKIAQVAKSSLFVVLLTKFAGAPVVAVYNITNKMPLVFPELMSKLSLNYFTHFASLYERGLIHELKIEYQKIFNLGLQSTFFILCSLFFLNELFISIWVGTDKFIGNEVFIFILLNIAILLVNSFTGLIIQISGEFKKTPLFAVGEVVFILTLTSMFFEFYGIKGLVIALFISSFPSFIYSMFVVKKILYLKYRELIFDNAKTIALICVFLPIFDYVLTKVINNNFILLLVESAVFTIFFIAVQWKHVPIKFKLNFRSA